MDVRRSGLFIVLALHGCWSGQDQPPPPLPPAASFDPKWDGHDRGLLPQLRDAGEVFDAIEPHASAYLQGGLLVCSVEIPIDEHAASPPDLAMMLQVGTRPGVIVRPPYSNSWTAIVAWPATDLMRGQRVSMRIWDEDTWSNNDHIAKVETTFTGSFPLALRNADAKVECRALEAEALQTRLASTLARADAALDEMAAAAPPDIPSGRLIPPRPDAARHALTEAAALAGWAAPAVRTRVEREHALVTGWTKRVEQLTDELAAALPAPGEPLPIAGAYLGLTGVVECDPIRVDQELDHRQGPRGRYTDPCLLVIDMSPSPDRPGTRVDDHDARLLRAQLLSRSGAAFDPKWDDHDLTPDGHARVLFLIPVPRAQQSNLVLARSTVYRQPTVALRVR